jgi:hypothetical protein
MLNCGACGLTNRPYESACAHCARPLQDPEAAEAKRREWDALPLAIREDMERSFDRMSEGTLEYNKWLNKHRITHAVLGAALVNLTMNGSTFFAAPWTIPVDLALGAAAGLALNRWRGGAWEGAGIFFAAGAISFIVKVPVLGAGIWLGGWFLVCFAIFFQVLMGYLMGLKMDFEHADRSVTR